MGDAVSVPAPVVGRVYIAGPTFGVPACRGRRFVVRSIDSVTLNVLGKLSPTHVVNVAFMLRGRVASDGLPIDEWADVREVSGG